MNLEKILNLIGLGENKPKQSTFVYCECGNELVSDSKKSFVRDVYIDDRNVVHYACSICKTNNFFDFDSPVPIRLPISKEDNDVIEQYRAKFTSQ